MNQQNNQQKFIKQWNEIYKLQDEIMNGMLEKDEEIELLKKENYALKMKVARMEAFFKIQNFSISRRLPSELLNELFGSLPLVNAFGLLAKMPNGLLARNNQKMINGIKEVMMNNKLNEEDCGPALNISDDVIVAYTNHNQKNSVRAAMSIPKLKFCVNKALITFYFEVQILKGQCNDTSIEIGICSQQFPLENKTLGYENNTIGIWHTGGMAIDGSYTNFAKAYAFKKGDFVGLGIIHHANSKMECFATWNGKLLVKNELPSKFASVQLFPAVGLYLYGESIRVNFNKDKWMFKEFENVL